MVEKDLVLCSTELNPFNNYLSNFLGSVQLGGVFVIRFYQCTFYREKKNTGQRNSCILKIT